MDSDGVTGCLFCGGHGDLAKAIRVGGGSDDPHETVWIRDIVEEFSGFDALFGEIEIELLGALGVNTAHPFIKAVPRWDWWDGGEDPLAVQVSKRLKKPLGQYSADDWLLLVDWVVRRVLPGTKIGALVDRLAWNTYLAAKFAVAADTGRAPQAELLDLLTKIRRGPSPAVLRARENAWEYARARIGVAVRDIANKARSVLGRTMIDHMQEHGLSAVPKLEQKFRDTLGDLNRDWRRISVTETGEAFNTQYLGQFPGGTMVKRIEDYTGACPFCADLHGMEFEWVSADKPDKDGWKHVWPGKTNVGRSSSRMMRDGEGGLTPRPAEELWWPAAGVQHPNCRGRWVAVPEKEPTDIDPEFTAWMNSELAKVGKGISRRRP